MKISLDQLYNFAIGLKIFQIVPAWIKSIAIKEIFIAVTDCMNVVNEMEELIKFNYTDEDIETFNRLVTKFKTVRDSHEISPILGLTDTAVRIGIGEHLTSKLPNIAYKNYYEYMHITEGWL